MTTPKLKEPEAARHALPTDLIHDLRTPLSQIIGYSELMMEQAEAEGQLVFLPHLQKVRAAGYQLLALIIENFQPPPEAFAAVIVPGTE